MKKILFILPAFFLTIALHAQQTEDEVYVGKKYGNYKGTGIIIPETDRKIKTVAEPATVIGTVVEVRWCEEDCLTILVKKEDGTIVTIGTKDYGFRVSKKLVGQKIIVEGIDPAKRVRERLTVRGGYQKDIQFAASGILVIK